MRRRGRFGKSLTHFIAECKDCNFCEEDYVNGPRRTSRHAAQTGHRITGDYGYTFHYNEERSDDR